MTHSLSKTPAVCLHSRMRPGFEQRVFQAARVLRDAAAGHPGEVVFTTSLGAEDMVITDRIDIQTLGQVPAGVLDVNDIGEVVIELQKPLPLAPYGVNHVGGSLIVVDPATHRTSGALLVRNSLN